MVSQSFIKIGCHLIDFWLLYRHKIPRKSSFLIYNAHFNSSDFQNKKVFSHNLVFLNAMGSTETEYDEQKNLKRRSNQSLLDLNGIDKRDVADEIITWIKFEEIKHYS